MKKRIKKILNFNFWDTITKKFSFDFNKETKNKLRVIFMGTPDVAVAFLKYLIDNENVVAVFTAPDLPAGRNMKIRNSPVKNESRLRGVKLFQPNVLKDEKIIKQIQNLKPDLIVTVAYGHKIPDEIIDIPRFKSINIHFSLLPKYRGAAPVNWAIVKGEKETGVSCFYISSRMDAGAVIHSQSLKIDDSDNSEKLLIKLSKIGIKVLKESLKLVQDTMFIPIKQDETKVSSAPKLKKSDGKINWGLTSVEIYNQIRGFYPWPGAFTYLDTADSLKMVKLFNPIIKYIEEAGNVPGEILTVSKEKGLLIKCGHGAIWIEKVQLEGHKIVSGYDFYNGRNVSKGDIFES